jgi:hypothetical protein
MFHTEPIMRRFMAPQHQMDYWSEHPRVVISRPWKSRSSWLMIFGPSSEIYADREPVQYSLPYASIPGRETREPDHSIH